LVRRCLSNPTLVAILAALFALEFAALAIAPRVAHGLAAR
jgi:hypothetical protein